MPAHTPLGTSQSTHPSKLLAVLAGIALVGAIGVLVAMRDGMADIRNDDPAFQTARTGAPVDASPSVVHTYGPANAVDDDRSASDDIACFTPSEDSDLTGCNFDPHKRYDYVGAGLNNGSGAWVAVPDDYTFANGNLPPTGAELNATRDGTYDRELAGS